ncbi:hypothetical protein FDW84_01375 [Pseudarthrobacter sp. NamE5]|nr:hypothetical protein FDW84_01375 [Pseudarthrobacter sp. NamE5]
MLPLSEHGELPDWWFRADALDLFIQWLPEPSWTSGLVNGSSWQIYILQSVTQEVPQIPARVPQNEQHLTLRDGCKPGGVIWLNSAGGINGSYLFGGAGKEGKCPYANLAPADYVHHGNLTRTGNDAGQRLLATTTRQLSCLNQFAENLQISENRHAPMRV